MPNRRRTRLPTATASSTATNISVGWPTCQQTTDVAMVAESAAHAGPAVIATHSTITTSSRICRPEPSMGAPMLASSPSRPAASASAS